MVEKGPSATAPSHPSLDQRLCGEYLLPAKYYEELSGDKKGAKRIALGRKFVAAGVFVEALGRSSVTHGLETGSVPFIGLGTFVSIAGGMMQTSIKNRIGARWSLLLNEKIGRLGPHTSAISEILDSNNIPPEEVAQLDGLPTDVYNAEFKSPKLEQIKNVLIPMICGAAIGLDGNYLSALAISVAGGLTIPTGNIIYKKHLERTAKKRVGVAALHVQYMKNVWREHVRMTDKMNFTTYISDLIIAGVAMSGKKDYGPSIYAGLTGLKGFINILYAQKDREEAKRITKTARHLIEGLSMDHFLITPDAWQRHKESQGVDIYQGELPFRDGIVIKDFVAQKPSGKETQLKPLNLKVSKNKAVVLQAASGSGKSMTLMALMHLYEHRGSVHLIKDEQMTDVHALSGPEELSKNIVLITEDQLNDKDRIVDLFKPYFKEAYDDLYQEQIKKYKGQDRLSMEVAWLTADTLLEGELKKKISDVFPSYMKKDLIELRDKRNEWANAFIRERKGNLKKITAEKRTFGTLSAGERQSMMVLVAQVASEIKPRVAVILDEPLAGLDKKEKKRQLKELRKIKEKTALIIVSHDNIKALRRKLDNCPVINLNPKAHGKKKKR